MKKSATLFFLIAFSALQLTAQSFTHYLSRINGSERIAVYNACYDKQGNGYIAGWYKGSVTLNGSTYNSNSGESDPFVAKVDTLGNWKWFVPITETSDNGVAFDVAVDSNLNVYVVGSIDSGARALSTTQTNGSYGVGNTTLFLLKIAQTGNTPSVAWFKGSHVAQLVNDKRGASVIVDKSQNVIVASVHAGSGNYMPSFAGDAFVNNDINVGFVWKFNGSGAIVSKWESHGTNIQLLEDIGLDKSGSVFVTAQYETYNDSIQLAPGFNFKNSAGRSAYGAPLLLKFNNSLALQWARAEWTLGQSGFYNDLAIDTNGNAHVFCTYNDSVKIGTNYFNANAGYLKQAVLYSYKANGTFNFIKKYANTGGDVESNRIACDADNKMVISADLYSGVNSIEGIAIGNRSFVARINPANGNIIGVRTSVNDNINTIALAVRKNNVLLAGSNYVQGDALQFAGSPLTLPALSAGSEASYVVEFSDVALVTGVEELSVNDISVSLYPNPNSGLFNISFSDEKLIGAELSIVNTLGEKVFERTITANTETISLNRAAKGVYVLSINGKEGKATKRISIQ